MAGAIILAAGRGERLSGITAPFMKPALLVNGRPLIVRQIENALEVTKEITVVLAPENARAMVDLIEAAKLDTGLRGVQYVLQPRPTSVVDALKRGLMLYEYDVIVLMGDNVVPPTTVRQMWDDYIADESDDELLIATRQMTWFDAYRFTYRSAGIWFEKEVAPVAASDEEFAEVWVGPFIVKDSSELYAALGNGESIGRVFNAFAKVRTWPAQCEDIGVPEALQ